MKTKVLLFLLFCVPNLLFAGIDKIVTFGDSLSDNGNLYYFTKNVHDMDEDVPVIPKSPPYFEGHFSNGKVWVEWLRDKIGFSKKKLVDYAFGGAWVEEHHYSDQWFPPDLSMEVDWYIVDAVTDFTMDKHLYTFWEGANDYLDGRDDVEQATSNTVGEIKAQIKKLIDYGKARYFLILNMPNLGQTPFGLLQGEEKSQQLTLLSQRHNEKLAKMVDDFKAEYPDKIFMTIDIFTRLELLQSSKELDGVPFNDVRHPCFYGGYSFAGQPPEDHSATLAAAEAHKLSIADNPDLRTAFDVANKFTSGSYQCPNPGEFLFWDRLHPTTRVHEIMANEALELLRENDLLP